MTAQSSPRSAAASSLIMIAAGAAVAIVPATVQAVAARLFLTGEQATIAIAIGVGILVSAVAGALSLESRLADPQITIKTYLPYWAVVSGIAGGVLLVVFPRSPTAIAIALPLIMTGLQIARTHAIADHRWRSELVAAGTLAVGCGLAFWLALADSFLAVVALGVTVVLAQSCRSIGARHRVSERVSPTRAAWVGAETAVVASAPLLVNMLVLAAMSAADAVAFRLILTVLGVLQPLLGYLRTRLLVRSSPALTTTLTSLTLLALLGVLIADWTGLFTLIFSDAWSSVSFGALLFACMWKAASVPANIPFARMRRRGSVGQVFFARLFSALTYLSLAMIAALSTGSLMAVFIAFLFAELATFAIYLYADKRTTK